MARAGRVLDATCGPGETLRGGLERLCREALAADTSILLVSDEAAGPERLPIPMVLAVGAVHECLLEAGFRLQRDVVAVAGNALDVHDLACLITVGATAVHPPWRWPPRGRSRTRSRTGRTRKRATATRWNTGSSR